MVTVPDILEANMRKVAPALSAVKFAKAAASAWTISAVVRRRYRPVDYWTFVESQNLVFPCGNQLIYMEILTHNEVIIQPYLSCRVCQVLKPHGGPWQGLS
jgi:hypothetical protein